MRKILLSIIAFLYVASCAPQTQYYKISKEEEQQERYEQWMAITEINRQIDAKLDAIAYRLSMASKDFCNKDPEILLGFDIWNNEQLSFTEELFQSNRDQYVGLKKKYNLDDRYRIKNIYEGSKAYKAGLRAGDIPLTIGYVTVNTDAGANKNFLSDMLKYRETFLVDTVTLTYIHENDIKTIDFKPDAGCKYDIYLDRENTSITNAYANGEAVYVTKSMLNQLQSFSPDAIAIVLGHEFAHNIMEHPKKAQTQRIAGQILGGMMGVYGSYDLSNQFGEIGGNLFSVGNESEADYVGLYLVARAGYNYKEAKDLWQKMSADNPKSIYIQTTHPNHARRSAAVKKAIQEIDEKISKHEELIPNGLTKRNDIN